MYELLCHPYIYISSMRLYFNELSDNGPITLDTIGLTNNKSD